MFWKEAGIIDLQISELAFRGKLKAKSNPDMPAWHKEKHISDPAKNPQSTFIEIINPSYVDINAKINKENCLLPMHPSNRIPFQRIESTL